MDQSAAARMIQIQEQAMHNTEYRALLAEYRQRSEELARVLETLSNEDRNVIEDYLGLTAEMHRKILEMAVSADKIAR